MTNNQKQQLISEVVALLQYRINEITEKPTTSAPQPPQAIEMLTIKECAECVKGISAICTNFILTN